MQTKTVYQYHPDTREFMGSFILDESDLSPLEPGMFLVPGNCIEVAPPVPGKGQFVAESNGSWILLDIPKEPEPATPPEPTPLELQASLTSNIQRLLDARARSLNYDSIASAITYRGDPNPKFATEAEAFFLWRSAVWTKAYEVLATGDIPTIPEAIALMPPLSITYPESP